MVHVNGLSAVLRRVDRIPGVVNVMPPLSVLGLPVLGLPVLGLPVLALPVLALPVLAAVARLSGVVRSVDLFLLITAVRTRHPDTSRNLINIGQANSSSWF